MRYKKIVKPIAFIIGLIILLHMIGYLLIPEGSARANILKVPQNTLDYLAVGDSECFASISPMEIWNKYGYAGYNCGSSGQRLQDTFYMLEEFLQKQSPKVILLETNEVFNYSSFAINLQNTVDNFCQNNSPVFKYHDRWKKLFGTQSNIDPKQDNYLLKGFNYNTTTAPYINGTYVTKINSTLDINRFSLFYLNKIVNLCKEKNIQLILFCAPSPMNWTCPKHNGIAAFAEKNNLVFIDLNLLDDKLGLDWSSDTSDKGDHINFYGAKKATDYIGLYLSTNIGLKDHRKEDQYVSWNNEMNDYLKLTQQVN